MEASWLLESSMHLDLVYAKLFPFNLSTTSSSSTNAARDWATILYAYAGVPLDHFMQGTCSQQDTLGGKRHLPTLTFLLLLTKACRLYFYVEFAFACALLILAFIFVEESAYKRVVVAPPTPESDGEKGHTEHVEVITLAPPRKSWLQTLKPWSGIDHEAEFFKTMLRSFSYFLVPSVLWVVTSFGKSTIPSVTPATLRMLTMTHRHLHRSRCPDLQLHFPHQDRSTTLQLEPQQQRSHRSGQYNRLRFGSPLCLFLRPHSRLAHLPQQLHPRSRNETVGTTASLPHRPRWPDPLRFHRRTKFTLDRLFRRRRHGRFRIILLLFLCTRLCSRFHDGKHC